MLEGGQERPFQAVLAAHLSLGCGNIVHSPSFPSQEEWSHQVWSQTLTYLPDILVSHSYPPYIFPNFKECLRQLPVLMTVTSCLQRSGFIIYSSQTYVFIFLSLLGPYIKLKIAILKLLLYSPSRYLSFLFFFSFASRFFKLPTFAPMLAYLLDTSYLEQAICLAEDINGPSPD